MKKIVLVVNYATKFGPVIDQENEELRAINILPKNPDLKKHRKVISYFEKLPIHDKNMVNYSHCSMYNSLEPMSSSFLSPVLWRNTLH